MKIIRELIEKYNSLDTVEKKSFWAIAPTVAVIGFISIPQTFMYYKDAALVSLAAGSCSLFAIIMMFVVSRTKDYHKWYPVFCAVNGGILVPVTFLMNGGFHSGMPLSTLSATLTCACCYEKRGRVFSFLTSFVGSMAAFLISKSGFNTLFEVSPEWVADDMIFSYVVLSIGQYLVLNNLLDETRHYVRNTEILSEHVDSQVRSQLVETANSGGINPEGTRKKVSVLFVDVSRFTATTERMEPETAAEYLNWFFSVAEWAVHKNGGVVDKYIGDCAMAYWIDPEGNYSGILDAIRAALDIRDKLYEDAEDLFRRFGTEMNVSAGVEYGDVVLGNIGSDVRKDYTVIGDTVNTANRLQGAASPGELIISGSMVEKIGELLELSPDVHEASLKGKSRPVKLYSVLGIREQEKASAAVPDRKQIRSTVKVRSNGVEAISNDGKFRLYICGCRGSLPVSGIRFSEFGGATSCYIIRKNDYAVVIDAGTGLLDAANVLAGCSRVDILFTHVHYDHILGILNMAVFPKGAELRMFGHFGGWLGENTIGKFLDTPYWPITIPNMPKIDVVLGREYRIDEDVGATFYRSFHPDSGCVIKLMVGRRKICIYSDLEEPSYLDPEVARWSDILLYDGMWDKRDPSLELHRGWGHSTWQDGVEYAKEERVQKLIITHHDPKVGDHELRERENLAQEDFARVSFARAGDIIEI